MVDSSDPTPHKPLGWKTTKSMTSVSGAVVVCVVGFMGLVACAASRSAKAPGLGEIPGSCAVRTPIHPPLHYQDTPGWGS
jgi:hypothetical protein